MNLDQFVAPSWLGSDAFELLLAEARICWEALDEATPESDAAEFQRLQNSGMMLKFSLEQNYGNGTPTGRAKALLEREFGSLVAFRDQCQVALERHQPDWLTWCLSFATFRFHLFPINPSAPFCTSAILMLCTRRDVAKSAGFSPSRFVDAQLDNMDWDVIERRIACLEKPLEVFEDAKDCQADTCA